jgi:hypothetical protein
MIDLERAMNPGGLPGPVAAEKIPRKPRKKAVKKAAKKRAAKAKAKPARGRNASITMDLAGTMELMGSMHRTDIPVFQLMSEAMTARGKPSRLRLLAALVKVFG